MPTIPQIANREYVSLPLIARGKVRDTYALQNSGMLLPVATDRVSIFDFVLPAEVPQKGEVLAAMNAFWILHFSKAGFLQDVMGFGQGMDHYLPARLHDPVIQKRGIAVKKLNMIPVEAIVRGYLTGSGWTAYTKTAPNHLLCGHSLRPDLEDGDRLPEPIFTPTTKAEEGHDEHMDTNAVSGQYGNKLGELSIQLFKLASKIALKRGIILADTKLEFGLDPVLPENASADMQNLILGDERFTPDSSRFWLLKDWENSRTKGTSPISFDKQFVREWGKTKGVHECNPLVPEDVKYVHGLAVPPSVLLATRQLYRYIFYLLTGKRLEVFQREDMGIRTPLPPVEVIVGSTSDLGQIEKGLDELREKGVPFRVHVMSCHRNPDVLRQYAVDHNHEIPFGATIIAAAGKAAALPGVLSGWLRYYGQAHIPVIGVALQGKNRIEDEAAILSIEQLPGNPVILDNHDNAFFGSAGFHAACVSAMTKDFFIPPSASREAQFNIQFNIAQVQPAKV